MLASVWMNRQQNCSLITVCNESHEWMCRKVWQTFHNIFTFNLYLVSYILLGLIVMLIAKNNIILNYILMNNMCCFDYINIVLQYKYDY